ncbi:2Fe-2S iron-sulfur cluster-binding protein [Hwanghaeella sp.]|uniref:2Fe-2S iron-sulfur cluster-binding protein n=1 Tax=Hwanghaeella sp. TaxID=2605943 RepID=UPI003CCB7B6F
MQTNVEFLLNGKKVSAAVEPRLHLADFIREEALASGTHIGCEQGVCGACTVFVDGRPTRSCITLAAACNSADIRTVEGFDTDPLMEAIRDSFKRHHGLQCGFCTPGMLTTAYDIIRRIPNADRQRIRKELSGNLCRCTGYAGIVDAIEDVLKAPPAAVIQPLERTEAPKTNPDAPGFPEPLPSDSKPDAAPDAAPGAASVTLPDPDSFGSAAVLTKSMDLSAGIEEAWQLVSDPEAIVACIPGATLSGPVKDGIANGTCSVSAGPIKASFKGSARIRYVPETKSGQLVGSGRDGFSRSGLEGRMDFQLVPHGRASRINLEMRYRLNGPLSQFGRPALVEEIANGLLSDIAQRIDARLSGSALVKQQDQPTSISGLRLLFNAIKGLVRRTLSTH